MLHKHEPVTEEKMRHISPNCSICQILRDIYHGTDDPRIRLNCRVAVTMAKKMDVKLTENKKDWDVGFWDKQNPDRVIEILDKTKRRAVFG
jgi:hypothetical protein